MKNKTGWLLLIAVLLTACAPFGVHVPQTPEGVRQYWNAHSDDAGIRIERFEVARPLSKVAQFIKRKANQCLNARVDTTSRGSFNTTIHSHHTYTPFATISDKAAEIHVMVNYPPGTTGSTDEIMIILADLHPVSKTKTKVELYYSSWNLSTNVAKAFKPWSTGEDIGCPTLE
jgi:hypothetical protein